MTFLCRLFLRYLNVSHRYWLLIAVLLLLSLYPVTTAAAGYNFPSFSDYDTFAEIAEPSERQMYYGNLAGFPHTYYFSLVTETTLDVDIFFPEIESMKTDFNAIIVEKQTDGSVVEVARMNASTATRAVWHDSLVNDTFQHGPSFVGVLKPGDYLLEINSPTNEGKYALEVGSEKPPFLRSLIDEFTRVHSVKRFMEKSGWSVFESPLYYTPLLLLVLLGVTYYLRRQWWRNNK